MQLIVEVIMKTRILEVERDNGKKAYICQYKWLFWWRPCNTYITHFPRGSCRDGYSKREYAEERIRDFLAGEP
jgi:hypothetical protein